MQGSKILVIEDSQSSMLVATALLKVGGHTALTASTAEEGIEIAIREAPRLILMDISLPGMDGLTATGILRKDPRTKDIPIVALTAHAMKGDEEKARAAGCVGYITKPIDTRSFYKTIEEFVRHDCFS